LDKIYDDRGSLKEKEGLGCNNEMRILLVLKEKAVKKKE